MFYDRSWMHWTRMALPGILWSRAARDSWCECTCGVRYATDESSHRQRAERQRGTDIPRHRTQFHIAISMRVHPFIVKGQCQVSCSGIVTDRAMDTSRMTIYDMNNPHPIRSSLAALNFFEEFITSFFVFDFTLVRVSPRLRDAGLCLFTSAE